MPVRLATAVVALVLLALPAAATAAPAISGTDGRIWNAADPAPSYTVSSSTGARVQWRLDSGEWSAARGSPVVVTLDPVADGEHVLAAREAPLLPVLPPGAAVQRRFRVDTTGPRIEIGEPRQGAVYGLGQPVAARYACAGATICAGPVADGQPMPTDRSGPASFTVRAADDAGNQASARVDYSVASSGGPGAQSQVIRVGPVPEPEPSLRVPGTRNARRLSPPAGARLTTLRPLLRWRPRAGARLYNVQLFVVEGATPRKVHSAFPASARYRVPRGVLGFGRRYLWRAWPYLAGGYTRAPVGVSFFDVGRPVRLSARQLAVNQRIAQAAVRRIAAVQSWLDEGLTTGDLRDGGLGRSDFTGAVALSGAGAPIANGLASPRPLAQPPPRARSSPPVAVTRRQLLINQRISRAALLRAVALERRLAGGLTGGDLRAGAVTRSKLAPGLSVSGAGLDGPGAPPSATRLLRAPRRGGAAVRLSEDQLLVNQRISQAAVRRANRLAGLVEGGLTGAHFREGSIGARALAAELR
ncbi:MAG TPA: hypothetical protein VK904_07530 [Miltoncostaeaceae bacterium]|nr:hypothetical protein [Miltoncostaeaceae bacterium]